MYYVAEIHDNEIKSIVPFKDEEDLKAKQLFDKLCKENGATKQDIRAMNELNEMVWSSGEDDDWTVQLIQGDPDIK